MAGSYLPQSIVAADRPCGPEDEESIVLGCFCVLWFGTLGRFIFLVFVGSLSVLFPEFGSLIVTVSQIDVRHLLSHYTLHLVFDSWLYVSKIAV